MHATHTSHHNFCVSLPVCATHTQYITPSLCHSLYTLHTHAHTHTHTHIRAHYNLSVSLPVHATHTHTESTLQPLCISACTCYAHTHKHTHTHLENITTSLYHCLYTLRTHTHTHSTHTHRVPHTAHHTPQTQTAHHNLSVLLHICTRHFPCIILCVHWVNTYGALCVSFQRQSSGAPSPTLSWTSKSARPSRSPTAAPQSPSTATPTPPRLTDSVWVSCPTSTEQRLARGPGEGVSVP